MFEYLFDYTKGRQGDTLIGGPVIECASMYAIPGLTRNSAIVLVPYVWTKGGTVKDLREDAA
jgi:hypothetical protein